MKTYLLAILCLLSPSQQVFASGCDNYAEGNMRIEKVERMSTRSFNGLSQVYVVICITRFSGHNCMPALLPNPSPSLEFFEPEQTESQASWDHFALPEDVYQKFYNAFRFGRFQATQLIENVFGSIDHNCSGDDEPVQSGRTRLEIQFDDPNLGTWNFAYPGKMTARNKQPLFN